MSAVAVLRPAYPRGDCHLVLLIRHRRLFLVEPAHFPAHRLLDALAHQLLMPVELVANIVQGATMLVVTVLCHGENLPVALDGQPQLIVEVSTDGYEHLMKVTLALGEEDYVIGILRSIHLRRQAYLCVQTLIHPVHEIGKHQVGEILRQVVAYRKSGSGVYNLVKQPKQILVLDFPAHDAFQHIVVYGRIELLDVDFQTIERPAFKLADDVVHSSCTAFYASVLNA